MNYLRVKNWEEFQHYKDRNPPWIKLHRALLDDYEFARLPDASKAHLMLIWLLASQSGGRIPDDPKFLQAKLGLDKQPDLQLLVEYGFLLLEQGASTPLQQAASVPLDLARSREERREEAEENLRRFGRFWLAYPKRVAKPDALKAWKKLALTFEQFERLMASLDAWKRSEQWTRDGSRFIPHPATWLNKRMFEDDAPAAGVEAPASQGARVVDLGNCPCGAPATLKVGGRPRCAAHVRGYEGQAAA